MELLIEIFTVLTSEWYFLLATVVVVLGFMGVLGSQLWPVVDVYATQRMVQSHFFYKRDPKSLFDSWKIHDGQELFQGDCEDYALTLLYELSEQSMIKMTWYLCTFQAVIWHTKSSQGNNHAVLWFQGKWSDNAVHGWYSTDNMIHKRRFPYPAPLVFLKLALS